jgi:hypothetical protein
VGQTAIEEDEVGCEVPIQNAGSRKPTHVSEEVSFEQLDFCPLPVYDSRTAIYGMSASHDFISPFHLHTDVIFNSRLMKTSMNMNIPLFR